jgi:hypothetical protein
MNKGDRIFVCNMNTIMKKSCALVSAMHYAPNLKAFALDR